jgi:hypothetical protein
MAMMGGMGMRTIWITLRAVNYTQRVFQEVIKSMQNLRVVEEHFGKVQLENLRIGNAMIMTGMMMTTIGQTLAQNMMNLAMSTEKGAHEMALLQKEIEQTKIAFADSMYEVLKATGVLDTLHWILNAIRSNKALQWIVGILLLVGSTALVVMGGIMLLGGSLLSLNAIATLLPKVLGYLNLMLSHVGITANIAAMSFIRMGVAIAGAFAAFMLIVSITEKFGKVAGVVVGLAVAIIGLALAIAALKGVITMGASLATDIGVMLAVAGIAGTAYALTSMQAGTRSARYTGPHMVHQGEVIYNPATHRPTQVGNDIEEGEDGERRGVTHYEMPVTIENVNTKADIDDLDERLSEAWRRKMRRRR